MIIFGGVADTPKLYGPAKLQYCFACKKESMFLLLRIKKTVNLFLIPVLPLQYRYYLICPTCGNRFEITEEQFKHYMWRIHHDRT
jgi:hypothetical protein